MIYVPNPTEIYIFIGILLLGVFWFSLPRNFRRFFTLYSFIILPVTTIAIICIIPAMIFGAIVGSIFLFCIVFRSWRDSISSTIRKANERMSAE